MLVVNLTKYDDQGDLNADYAVRVSKFLEAYEKTPAPAAGDGEYGFKGYQVSNSSLCYICSWDVEDDSLVRQLTTRSGQLLNPMCHMSLRVYIFSVLCRNFVPEKCLVSVAASPLDTLADE